MTGKAAPASALPADVRPYHRTAIFTRDTVPAGLLKAHSTKQGVWGLIHVLDGQLLYVIVDEQRVATETILVAGAPPGVVEPEILHHVEPREAVRFCVEFHR